MVLEITTRLYESVAQLFARKRLIKFKFSGRVVCQADDAEASLLTA
jgi:hypothetical protein